MRFPGNAYEALRTLRTVVCRANLKAAPPPPVDAADFDWTRPHRFGREARGRLKALGAAAAGHIARQLTTLFRKEVQILATDCGEHYAAGLTSRFSAQDGPFVLPITDAAHKPCGLALVDRPMAFGWVDRLLGGGATSAADDQARTLAMLEATLLADIVGVMAAGFAVAAQACGGPALKAGETVATDAAGLLGPGNDILCGFDFEATLGDAKGAFSIYLLADALETVAEPEARKKKKRSPDDVRKDLIAHLEQTPIRVSVRIGEATIPLGDAMVLEPGDVLVLNRKADEPVELMVHNRVAIHGFPVQCEGLYALKISERRGEQRVQLAVPPRGKESKT